MRDEDCILHKKTLLLVLGLGLVVLSANCGVVAQDKKNNQIHLARARVYAGDDRLDSAVNELRKAIEANPNDAESLAFLALLQGRRGDYLASVANIKKAVKIQPQNA